MIVPTYNERENIDLLLDRLGAVLADLDYEIIVVDDDSPDLTWELAEARAASDGRLRVLRRVGRRGLSSAVLDGMTASRGSVLAVMDADLQHDEEALPEIISAVLDEGAEVCLGTREAPGGSYGEFGPMRHVLSWVGAQLARRALGITVTDPMSGYFAVSRERFDAVRGSINPRGFKIMLELVARGPRPRIAEVPYRFRSRINGQTKLTSSVAGAYLLALADLALARRSLGRFATFVAVALTGLSFRFSADSVLALFGLTTLAPLIAAEIGVLCEFAAHDRLTFRSSRRNRLGTLVRFHVVSLHAALALSSVANIAETSVTSPDTGTEQLVALGLSTAGVVAVVLVSFVLNSVWTWSRPRS